MNKTQLQLMWTLVWASPIAVLVIWTYVFKKLKRFEEESTREATKRTIKENEK